MQRTALVTEAGRGSGLAIVRSLGRKGWRVVAADEDARSPGFRSRFAAATVVYPAPRVAPDACAGALLAAAKRERVDLVLPVTDDSVGVLMAARERFAGCCRLALPAPEAWAIVSDKRRTLELARQLGIPVPRSITVASRAEAERAVGQLGWPVVLKPQASRRHDEHGGLQPLAVSYARDAEDLLARVGAVAGRYPILLQEYCAGEGCGVELLTDAGRPLAAFQHRRLAEIPLSGGASAWRESVPLDPLLYGFSCRLAAALRWTGPMMVEWKRGRQPWLMEINGRVWGSMPLAVRAGVDFPALWAELLMTGSTAAAEPAPYALGVRAYNPRHLLMWIGNVLLGRRRYPFLPAPHRGRALAGLWALCRDGSDFAAKDDPAPARAQRLAVARRLLRALHDGAEAR